MAMVVTLFKANTSWIMYTPGGMTGMCMQYLAISGKDLDTYTVCFIVDLISEQNSTG